MTRSEFLARFVIQHLSVNRAVKFADSLEEHEQFEGWDDADELSPEVELLLLRVGTLLEQRAQGADVDLGPLEEAYAPFADADDDDSPDSGELPETDG